MAIDTSPVVFTVKIIGNTTMEEFSGTFKIRPVLTQGQQIDRDNIVKELLGGSAKDASPSAVNRAFILADIRIRVTESPSWWRESRNGLDIIDDEILGVLYDECQASETKWRKEVQDKAAAAKAELAAK